VPLSLMRIGLESNHTASMPSPRTRGSERWTPSAHHLGRVDVIFKMSTIYSGVSYAASSPL
jgi:hypothetical protein